MNDQLKAFGMILLIVAAVVFVWLYCIGVFGCTMNVQVGPDHWPSERTSTTQPQTIVEIPYVEETSR